jgi:hypothetical protein
MAKSRSLKTPALYILPIKKLDGGYRFVIPLWDNDGFLSPLIRGEQEGCPALIRGGLEGCLGPVPCLIP